MEVSVTWKNGLFFRGTSETGFSVDLSADPEFGAADDGFRPLELMALSLAGCTAMDVIAILQKKRQSITEFETQVSAERAADHPRVFLNAVINYHITGAAIDETAVLRAIELSATRYCPAQAMLGKVFPIYMRYFIYESGPSGKHLVRQGEYTAPERQAS